MAYGMYSSMANGLNSKTAHGPRPMAHDLTGLWPLAYSTAYDLEHALCPISHPMSCGLGPVACGIWAAQVYGLYSPCADGSRPVLWPMADSTALE